MKDSNSKMVSSTASNRRNFFKQLLFFTGAGAVVYGFLKSAKSHAAGLSVLDLTGKKRTDAANTACVKAAKGIGYVEDLEKALKEKKTTKTDKPGSNNKTWKPNEQTCENCALYNMAKKTPAEPTCVLIPGCYVHNQGSCNSWAPKA